MTAPIPELMSVPEAAQALRRAPDTVHRWIREGLVPARLVGKVKFVRREDIEAMLGVSSGAEASVQAHRDAGEPVFTAEQMSLVRTAVLDAMDALAAIRPAVLDAMDALAELRHVS